MADPITQVTLRIKRGTSAEWAASPYVLASGEPGYDTTVKRLKVGDGVNQWALLKWQDVEPATLARVEAAAEAIEGATTPTDGAMAAVAGNPTSAFASNLSSIVDGRVDAKTPPIVVGILADDPSVVEAAAGLAQSDASLMRTEAFVIDDSDDAVYLLAKGAHVGLNKEGWFNRKASERIAAQAFLAPEENVIRDASGRIISQTLGGVVVENMIRDASGRLVQYTADGRTVTITRDAAGRLIGEN